MFLLPRKCEKMLNISDFLLKILLNLKYYTILKASSFKTNDSISIKLSKKCPNTLCYNKQKTELKYLFSFLLSGLLN